MDHVMHSFLGLALSSRVFDGLAQMVGPPPNYPAYRPFLMPAPIWDYWFWLLLPLSIGVAVAYKTTKVSDVKAIPKEAALLTFWIVGGLIAAAVAVAIVAKLA